MKNRRISGIFEQIRDERDDSNRTGFDYTAEYDPSAKKITQRPKSAFATTRTRKKDFEDFLNVRKGDKKLDISDNVGYNSGRLGYTSKLKQSESSPTLRRTLSPLKVRNANNTTITFQENSNKEMDASKRFKFLVMSPISNSNGNYQDDQINKLNNTVSSRDDINYNQLLSSIMNKGDLIIFVEHCCNCSTHDSSLRHNERKYFDLANAVLRTLAQMVHLHKLNIRLGVIRLIPSEKRVGAFEVGALYRSPTSGVVFGDLHSKLECKNWPKIEPLKVKLKAFLYGAGIPILLSSRDVLTTTTPKNTDGIEGIDSYPVGLCPWEETALNDPLWEYINPNPDTLPVQWVFDFREEIKGPLLQKIQIEPNPNSSPNKELLSSENIEPVIIPNQTDGRFGELIECALDKDYSITISKEELERIGGPLRDSLMRGNGTCALSATLSVEDKASSAFIVSAVAMAVAIPAATATNTITEALGEVGTGKDGVRGVGGGERRKYEVRYRVS
eukprot:gene13344-28269_t